MQSLTDHQIAIAPNAKWGPALLPVPTSVGSCDPRPWQDAIIGPAYPVLQPQGEAVEQAMLRFLAKGRHAGAIGHFIPDARRSLSRVPGNGSKRPVCSECVTLANFTSRQTIDPTVNN
ncbi:hypothetical protein Q4610_20235 [Sphingobium sp. HBC34]|uniref:Uncharacterized protein n=1 Tax=Sphingobium cyanobacteriorum TaxID=3063954 RepID=A0ABT8ZSA7_9SPHN|nr:hypothetical protein [Sphingobium sp. HBC34]MDO7837378.1 hypothetical protein [Sphingobium sp. HBC34]